MVFTDVKGQPVDHIFKGKKSQRGFWTFEDGADTLLRNVSRELPVKYKGTLNRLENPEGVEV
jgi:hypothetical protein